MVMQPGHMGHYKKIVLRQFIKKERLYLLTYIGVVFLQIRFGCGLFGSCISNLLSLSFLFLMFQATNNQMIIHNTGIWRSGTIRYKIAMLIFNLLFFLFLLMPIYIKYNSNEVKHKEEGELLRNIPYRNGFETKRSNLNGAREGQSISSAVPTTLTTKRSQ